VSSAPGGQPARRMTHADAGLGPVAGLRRRRGTGGKTLTRGGLALHWQCRLMSASGCSGPDDPVAVHCRLRPLTTRTARFSYGWILGPTTAIGRCPLSAVLSMPSSRRSVESAALRRHSPAVDRRRLMADSSLPHRSLVLTTPRRRGTEDAQATRSRALLQAPGLPRSPCGGCPARSSRYDFSTGCRRSAPTAGIERVAVPRVRRGVVVRSMR